MSPAPEQIKTKPKHTADSRAGQRVSLRFEFYRDGWRMLLIGVLLSLGLNVLQAIVIYDYKTTPPDRTYFTVGMNNEVIKIVGLKEPFVTNAKLLDWARDKVSQTMQLDPANINDQVNRLSPAFTPEAFTAWKQSLIDSGTYDLMKRKYMVMSGVVSDVPVLVGKPGPENGVFVWHVRMPAMVDFTSAVEKAHHKRVIDVTIVRRHTIDNLDGLAITQIVSQEY